MEGQYGSTIDVSFSSDNEQVMLVVEDEGVYYQQDYAYNLYGFARWASIKDENDVGEQNYESKYAGLLIVGLVFKVILNFHTIYPLKGYQTLSLSLAVTSTTPEPLKVQGKPTETVRYNQRTSTSQYKIIFKLVILLTGGLKLLKIIVNWKEELVGLSEMVVSSWVRLFNVDDGAMSNYFRFEVLVLSRQVSYAAQNPVNEYFKLIFENCSSNQKSRMKNILLLEAKLKQNGRAKMMKQMNRQNRCSNVHFLAEQMRQQWSTKVFILPQNLKSLQILNINYNILLNA